MSEEPRRALTAAERQKRRRDRLAGRLPPMPSRLPQPPQPASRDGRRDITGVTSRGRDASRSVTPVEPPHRHVTSRHVTGVTLFAPEMRRPWILRTIVYALAAVTAAVGLYLNVTFLWAFGRTADASAVLAVTGFVTDAATLALPAVIATLWQQQRWGHVMLALPAYLAVTTITVMVALGFANANIGDAVTGRGDIAALRAAVIADLGRLRAERENLPAYKPTSQAAVEALVKARDQECPEHRLGSECRRARERLNAALTEREWTVKAAAIDAELRRLTESFATLAPVKSADPQAEAVLAVAAWLTRGALVPGARDIDVMRLLGIAMLPPLAGLLFAWARVLGERR